MNGKTRSGRGGRSIVAFAFACAGALLMSAPPALAVLTQIPTRAQFNAQFPGAPFEDFEEARVPDGKSEVMDPPLDSTTNNLIFQPGEIVPGLRLTVPLDPAGPNMFVSAPGFANYVSHAISFNQATTPQPQITIDFYNNNATAVGMDLTSNPNGSSVTVNVFSGAVNLGSFIVPNVQGAGTFFGVSSNSDIITRITLSDGNFFGVDNIAFNIPEPTTAGLMAGAGALLALLRRRSS